MNQEERFDLVLRAQAEDAEAMEQLLLWTYTPVCWLCRKLLQDSQAAMEQAESVMETIYGRLNTLQDPTQYEAWFCRITAARCAQILPQLRWGSTAREAEIPQEREDLAGKTLTETETVAAISAMVDELPEDARVCILLCCCAGMNSRTIAQVAGYTPESVKTYLAQGQQLLQEKLNDCQQKGTEFTGITTLKDILQMAMYQKPEGEDPIPMVYGILGKEIPDPEKQLRRLLTKIVVILAVLNLLLCGVLLLVWRGSVVPMKTVHKESYTLPIDAPAEETTAPATEETTEPTEQTTAETAQATEAQPAVQAETVAPATAPATQPTTAPAPQPTAAPSTEATVPEETAADGHTHRYLNTTTNFNCETGGTKRYLCADCDYYYTEELAPTGTHNLTVVSTGSAEATCTTAGKAAKICTKCNYAVNVEDPEKPALGHNYESTVVNPTSTEQGYTLHTCTRCGHAYQDTFVNPVLAEPTIAADPEQTEG